jgi:hypothetical protein
MVNVYLKCKPIIEIKGLIDEFNYWNWEDKEKGKLRKKMLVQFKLEHYTVIRSYLEL